MKNTFMSNLMMKTMRLNKRTEYFLIFEKWALNSYMECPDVRKQQRR